jgi:uncharacterized protein (TIGR02588 family)
MGRPDRPRISDPDPPLWEWAVAALGAVVLLAVLGFLAWETWRLDHSPPDPRLSVEKVVEQPGSRYLVIVRAENRGSQAAASLKISGRLRAGGTVESSDTEFQYLPGASHREAGLFFTHDPRGGELTLSVESYQQP